jgi:hypothetical protein
MSAPGELQDPLLRTDSVNVTCQGVRATLEVDADGGISYSPIKVSWHCCLVFRHRCGTAQWSSSFKYSYAATSFQLVVPCSPGLALGHAVLAVAAADAKRSTCSSR